MKQTRRIAALATALVLFLVFAPVQIFSEDAHAIVEAARNRLDATTVSTRSRMVLVSKDGSTSERLIDQYSSDSPKGDRTIIVFQKPASVAGTRFLTMENRGGADDRWIFLPSLGKVRRIASAEGSGSFMGTDLSYDDISSTDRDVSLDTHVYLREETLSGHPCHVIESTPIDSDYQYSKMISWIDKDTLVVWKINLFDRKGELVKELEVLEVKDVQTRITPVKTRMTTLAAKTSTTINVEIIKYDDTIPEGVFTVDFLSTGRVK